MRVDGSNMRHFDGPHKPLCLAISDATDQLVVVDIAHPVVGRCVQVYELDGRFVRQFGSAGTDDGQFVHPGGIAISSGEVFVSDTVRNIVQVFEESSGKFLRKLNSGDYRLRFPLGLCVVDNRLLVCDALGKRVLVLDR